MRLRNVALAVLLLLSWEIEVASQQDTKSASPDSELWIGFQRGPYAVGFDVLYTYDEGRSWKRKFDADDHFIPPPRSRPVRISVWYPAAPSPAEHITYADYVVLHSAPDANWEALNQRLSERNLNSLRRIMKGDGLTRLLRLRMVAQKQPPAAKGKFPLVLYAPGLNESWQHANPVMAEVLASHGYVVATVPQLGTDSEGANLQISAIDFETQVRDMEHVLEVLRNKPYVDENATAAMGHSVGAAVLLALAMRNAEIDAVIGLDGAYTNKRVNDAMKATAYYAPERFYRPLLDLRRADNKQDTSVLDALRYSDKLSVEFSGITHGDFTSFPFIAQILPTDIQGRTPEVAAAGHRWIIRISLWFLDANLRNNESAKALIKALSKDANENRFTVTMITRLQRPPSPGDLFEVLQSKGVDSAVRLYREVRDTDPKETLLSERTITALGYEFLENGREQQAVNLFRLLTTINRTSADAFDSLAEAYFEAGDITGMKAASRMVLELLATDGSLDNDTKESLRKAAEERLKTLDPR
jgi:dienelactone hydrolase